MKNIMADAASAMASAGQNREGISRCRWQRKPCQRYVSGRVGMGRLVFAGLVILLVAPTFLVSHCTFLHYRLSPWTMLSCVAFVPSPRSFLFKKGVALREQKRSSESKSRNGIETVSFTSPLLDDGYLPAVMEAENHTLNEKPLLLYLPGFDGTILAPFLQFPELGTVFDVRGMSVSMEDRSTFEELRDNVVEYLRRVLIEEEGSGAPGSADEADASADAGTNASKAASGNPLTSFVSSILPRKGGGSVSRRPVYLLGESFGGILAVEAALSIVDRKKELPINLKGIVLVNPATCYDRSRLAALGPPVANLPSALYPFGLLRLIPLFTDDVSLPQLLLILQAKALPSVIDTPAREAYMGRVALSLSSRLKFMPRDTLDWRLSQWLERGCADLSEKGDEMSSRLGSIPILVVAGEVDRTLPSIAEAERLLSLLPDCTVHVVEGAGHASTCGSRVDLAALMRGRFRELQQPLRRRTGKKDNDTFIGRTAMKEKASQGVGARFGLEPRYDNAKIGLSPLLYWSKENYRKWKER